MSVINIAFDTPFAEAIEAAITRDVVLPDVYYEQLQGTARSLAFSVAGITMLDQLQLILDSLVQSLATGQTFKSWKKSALKNSDALTQLPKHRLDNIFRTNIQGAYARGQWQHQDAHKKSRPYLMYSAINDSRTRPTHAAMDGYIAPVDDPVWDNWYAPNGYRCRCSMISLSQSQAENMAQRDLERVKNNPDIARERMTARPDKGWDYHGGKDDSLTRIKIIEQQKLAKAPDAVKAAFNDRLQGDDD